MTQPAPLPGGTLIPTALTGHTLTVEQIVDVPELERTHLRELARNTFSGPVYVIVERRDGVFVADHGSDHHWWRENPGGDVWDSARWQAEWLSCSVGPYEDLRYVGPGRVGDWHVSMIRQGWLVRLTERGPWRRVIGIQETINLAEMRRTGQLRARKRTFVLEGGRIITRSIRSYLVARPLDGVR